jgi:hypothetical protein
MNTPTLSTLTRTIGITLALAFGAGATAADDVTRIKETKTTTDASGRTTTTTTVRFEDYDTNADGIILKQEIPTDSTFSTVWMQYDADGDLRITPVEFQKWTLVDADTQRVKQTTVSTDAQGNTTTTTTVRFEDLDSNADGYIVKSELRPETELSTVWMRYDADGDLRITPVEYKAYSVASPEVRTVQKHSSQVVNADGTTTRLTTTTEVQFEDWDQNADGVLIQSEIPTDSGFVTVWKEYDADRNLTISPAEFDAWLLIVQDEEEEA